jgi:MFS family permease
MAFPPVFAGSLGIKASGFGLLVSVNILLTALLQGPFGKIADKYSKVFLVVLGSTIASCAILIMPLIPGFRGLLLMGIVIGCWRWHFSARGSCHWDEAGEVRRYGDHHGPVKHRNKYGYDSGSHGGGIGYGPTRLDLRILSCWHPGSGREYIFYRLMSWNYLIPR